MSKTQRIVLGLVTSGLLATLYYGVVWAQGGAAGAWHGHHHGDAAFGYGQGPEAAQSASGPAAERAQHLRPQLRRR